MSARKPFTLRERARFTQFSYGRRPTNGWDQGDLPAPWAEGDVVRLVGEVGDNRLRGVRGRAFLDGDYFVVDTAFSVDEGDGWYFRVTAGEANRLGHLSSDRLHVFRGCDGVPDCDYMEAFELVESADPKGLELRERMLADGWSHEPAKRCPTCGGRR